jgi:surface polysaccharide O-acyltransferase-like enzyme
MRARRYARQLRQVSACTLGVYCVHIFVLRRFESATGLQGAGLSPWWAIPFTAACVFAAALAAVMLLRRARIFRLVT